MWHLLMIEGKILLSIFIVQVFRGKELLELVCRSCKDWFLKFPFWEEVVILKAPNLESWYWDSV